MGTFDHYPGPDVGNPQNQDEHDQNLPGDAGMRTAESTAVSVDGEDPLIIGDGTVNGADLPGIDTLADNDLLVAMMPVSSDNLANIGHTLDQLTSATNLFDVPAFDLDSSTGS